MWEALSTTRFSRDFRCPFLFDTFILLGSEKAGQVKKSYSDFEIRTFRQPIAQVYVANCRP